MVAPGKIAIVNCTAKWPNHDKMDTQKDIINDPVNTIEFPKNCQHSNTIMFSHRKLANIIDFEFLSMFLNRCGL